MSIIISNLIIGLTVNQTEELFKEAGVIRLEKTVLQILGVRDVLGILPKWLERPLRKRATIFPLKMEHREPVASLCGTKRLFVNGKTGCTEMEPLNKKDNRECKDLNVI